MSLNKRQQKIFEIIKSRPTITLKEIAEKLGLKSISNIHAHIQNMIDKNFIARNGRNLIVKSSQESDISYIPFYGFAQCGYNDILTESNVVDYIPMPTRFLPNPINNLFLIKAKGDSMEPTITEGELLLFRKLGNEKPKENEIVLCFHGEGIKIKRYNLFRDKNGKSKPRLISDNKSKFEPIPIDTSEDNCNQNQIIAKLVKLAKAI